jgi:hypothetical protein
VIDAATSWDGLRLEPPLNLVAAELEKAIDGARRIVGAERVPWASRTCLADEWNSAARASRARSDVAIRRVSRATVVAALAGDGRRPAQLEEEVKRTMPATASSFAVPLLPATDGRHLRHESYRNWFSEAVAIDAGELVAIAFVHVGEAVRAAVGASGAQGLTYDGGTHDVTVREGDHAAVFNAHWLSFLAVVNGMLPEDALLAALVNARGLLSRLAEYVRALAGIDSDIDTRFDDDTPVHRSRQGRLVADPDGERCLAGEPLSPSWRSRLTACLSDATSPLCTCTEERRTRLKLRLASEFYSISAGSSVQDLDVLHVGPKHALLSEVACPHAARPADGSLGANAGDVAVRWLSTLSSGAFRFRTVRRLGFAATAIHGSEVGTLAAVPELLSALGAGLDYADGTEMSAAVPTANLLLVTNEPPEATREVLESKPGADALMTELAARGLDLGPRVGFVTTQRVGSHSAIAGVVRTKLAPMEVAVDPLGRA